MTVTKPVQLCFYDYYRSFINDNIMYLENPVKHRELGRALGHIHTTMNEFGITEEDLVGHIKVPQIMYDEQKYLRLVKPHIITKELATKAFEAIERAKQQSIPYLPFPVTPFWIEFGLGEDAFSIGDANYRAMFVRALQGKINVSLIDRHYTSKDLFFDEHGTWAYQQSGPCASKVCPRGVLTEEGKSYTIKQHEHPEMKEFCVCAQAGFRWAQFIKMLAHIMRQQAPIIHEEVSRQVPLPHAKPRKKREEAENARQEAENKRNPNYIIVSLSAPVRLKHYTPSEGPGTHLTTTDKIPVTGHWRFLIPGLGKPWKGEEMQIIFIEGFERTGHIVDRSYLRTIVTP